MGYKPLPREIKDSLYRDCPKEIRHYKNSSIAQYKLLIDSFTQEEFILYDVYYKKWGTPGRKRQSMLDAIERHGVTGNVKILAEIRVKNLYEHQQVYLSLRNRCTHIYDYKKATINNSESKVWLAIARRMQSSHRSNSMPMYYEWIDKENTTKLAEFLKDLYNVQGGKCALSLEPMVLEIGANKRVSNKCSPDRIDSNKGYEPGNIQLTTWWANNMKMNMTTDELYNCASILHNARLLKDK